MATYDVGDEAHLYVVFRDETGAQAEPSLVELRIVKPGGLVLAGLVEAAEEADLDLAGAFLGEELSSATGVYKTTVQVDSSGVWCYVWLASGDVVAATPGWFDVRRERVGEVTTS